MRFRLASGSAVALVLLLGLAFVAVFGAHLAPYQPVYYVVEHGSYPRPYDPGIVFPLGSDVLGRDLLSLVLAGAQATLTIVLVAGLARVGAGVVLAAVASRLGALGPGLEASAQLVSAVPATLAALLLIKVFVPGDVDLATFVLALLLFGWAGPYRVIRSEVDRLAVAPFTEGARSLGLTRWRLFWRHQLPHLAPTIATNVTQQVVASLVLVAELGVLGVAVGQTRRVNVEESLSLIRPGEVNALAVPDIPEWGAMLAGSRTVEALWVTRWLILVPGVAFALTALAVAVLGFVLARRYARLDLIADLRGRGAAGLSIALALMFLVSGLIPERYAAAREWAADARARVESGTHLERTFREEGLVPIGESYSLVRETVSVRQTAPATVRVGGVELTEPWPRVPSLSDPARTMRSFVASSTGGGVVEAPLVFAGRGISADDYRPRPIRVGGARQLDFAQLIRDEGYPDDYAEIDPRGKVVLLVRFAGFRGEEANRSRDGYAFGPLPEQSIAAAIRRGAAAVLFVDPALWLYTDVDPGYVTGLPGGLVGGINPYGRTERFDPPMDVGGVPVVILGPDAAHQLTAQFGIELGSLLDFDVRGDARHRTSLSRDFGVSARVEVPLERLAASATSIAAEIAGVPTDAPRVVVWSVRGPGSDTGASAVLEALARSLSRRAVPFVLVDFDPAVDAEANAKAVRAALGDRPIRLVLVLDELTGGALRFTTPHGELLQAFDLYAAEAGVPHLPTLQTAGPADMAEKRPFPDLRTVLIRGNGQEGDLRAPAAALIGYIAGRLALGAPELRQTEELDP